MTNFEIVVRAMSHATGLNRRIVRRRLKKYRKHFPAPNKLGETRSPTESVALLEPLKKEAPGIRAWLLTGYIAAAKDSYFKQVNRDG